MRMYLKEKIGNPDLFTGRKKELSLFLKWINGIKREISMSTAILSRRKTGKTALLQRLYNLTFEKNDSVIPFYYEIKEGKIWAIDFCKDFFLTFIYQYIAFKTRKTEYLSYSRTFDNAIEIARQEDFDHLIDLIKNVEISAHNESVDTMWLTVRDAPLAVANLRGEFIVQLIDEFQYFNSQMYRDKAASNLMDDFAAGYMSTAEYKNAPLLISGSWVGWLRDLLYTMLPSRFRQYFLENMPEDETIEMVYKYSQIMEIPITEDIAYIISRLSEGNPFYVSSLFQSYCPERDFTAQEGVLKTLEFETLNAQGHIRGVWMEYLAKVFYKVNERHSKYIVLYLSKYRHREVTRKELLEKLELDMTDFELEQKLHALVKSDIIEQGRSNFYYQGVQDNIFDKVFRGVYADDVKEFDPRNIHHEYQALYEQSQKNYHELLGRYNYTKGWFAEFAIINQLRLHAYRQPADFLSITHNLPKDFQFVQYENVWSYKTARADKRDVNIDVFARARNEEYSLIWEVKNRDTKTFSADEAAEFLEKVKTLQEREHIEKAVAFVFSRKGFTHDALDYFRTHNIAWSDDERWLG